MTALSQAQIAMYAQSAGLSADRAQVAAAVAMAESGGRTDAHNPVPPDDSYGLWQINMIGSMGPSRRASLGISSNTQLYDPAVNARAMAQISRGGSSFSPWSTYTSGAYRKYLGAGAVAASWDPLAPFWDGLLGKPKRGPGSPDWNTDPFGLGSLPSDGGGLGLGDVAGGIKSISELLIGAAQWMANAHNWVRVTQVGIGAVMVGVGLAVVTRGTWQPAAQAISSVTPVGRAATAARTATKPKAAA